MRSSGFSLRSPSDALALAEKMAALIAPGSRKPIYVDCAVSPPTKVAIGDVILSVRGCRHHRLAGHSSYLHASGPDAAKFGVLNDFGIKVSVIEAPIGAA